MQVRAVQNAAIGVRETSEQERQPHRDVGHVGHRHHQPPTLLQRGADLGQQAFRLHQVLQYIEQQNPVEAVLSGLARQFRLRDIQIRGDVALQRPVLSGAGQRIHADDAIAVLFQLRREEPFAAADIQHILTPPHQLPRVVVAGMLGVLDRVVDEVLGELRRAHHAAARPPVAPHRAHHVARILQPVHVAQFGPVVSRDGNLPDLHGLMVQFDDDFGIEVKIVGHPGEIELRQGVQVIGAISAVKLREVHSQRAILQDGEDAVAGILIQRHASLQRPPVGAHHARAEHGVRLARDQRAVKLRQNLRRVLPVAMQQHDDVEALLDEIAIARLLIASIAQISGMLQYLQLGHVANRLDAHSQFEGAIRAGIVEHHHFLDVAPHAGRNALEHGHQRGNRVVRDHQDADAFALAIGDRGVGVLRKGSARFVAKSRWRA